MNANIAEIKEIHPPFDLQMKYPLSVENAEFIRNTRLEIANILEGNDPRLVLIHATG